MFFALQKDITPLPWKRLAAMAFMLISTSTVSALMFSISSYMILDLGMVPDGDKRMVGYYAGWLASAYFIAQFLTATLWGWVSDHKGRRPVLLIAVAGSAVSMVMLGFSFAYWWAVLARVVGGLLTADFSVAKSYVTDLTDKSNRSIAFSVTAVSWALGTIIGPALGGLTSRVLPEVALFAKFPYLLPSVICVIQLVCAWIVGYFYLPESLGTPSMDQYNLVTKDEFDVVELEEREDPNAAETQLDGDDEDPDPSIDELTPRPFRTPLASSSSPPSGLLGKISAKIYSALDFARHYKLCIWTICSYCIISFVYITNDEVFPVWAVAPTSSGGLDFSIQQIGYTWIFSGFFLIAFQLFAYTLIAAKFGPKWALRCGAVLGVVAFLAMPTASVFAESSKPLMWISLLFGYALRIGAGTLCFTSVNVLINESVPQQNTGTANGLAFALSAPIKALGPAVGASLMAWSLSNGLSFPLNYYFTYLILALASLLVLASTVSYPAKFGTPT